VVALLSSLVHAAGESATATGPLRPTLRVLIDEAANVAPLRDLPRFLSQTAGHGIRIATIWQSLGQMRERYGAASDTILANSTAKLFMGPITDDATRRYVVDLLGDEYECNEAARPRRTAKARAAALQQLAEDRALLVAGAAAPAIVRRRGWWEDVRLRRRGSA
jgi:type IV secretory pathway TraG/TraD family ATPase VirD4